MATKDFIEKRQGVIKDYLSIDPEIPTRTLAKKLHENEPDLFSSVENARSAIRYVRGENGKQQRKEAKIVKPPTKRRVSTPIGNIVPEADSSPEKVEPVNIKLSGHGTIISDIHMPYHSESALQAALEYSYKHNATDWLLINGDAMDFYSLSYFSRNPKARDMVSELEIMCAFLQDLSKYYDRIIYKLANHERRWETYLFTNAPEICNLPCLTYEALFKANELGIEIVRPQQIIHVGKYLTILHGHEFGRSVFNPVNPARGAFLRAQNNCIIGHHHQSSEHTEKDIRGIITSTWSAGCLCELRPAFLPINRWNHGFLTMHIEKNDFEVENHRIIKGKVR